LTNADPRIRFSALSLRFFPVDVARAALVEAAENPELDTALRGVATESLSMTGVDARVERALLALLTDPHPELRLWAAHALGYLADAAALCTAIASRTARRGGGALRDAAR